ncbi:MAG: hypothetical protein RMK89_13925 [Armatimonadota bacterium]|nr:hypothetical protein [Armatimonadota bacterium]MDW8144544.1 hypothetical protein [Armatimonadota bacterium]
MRLKIVLVFVALALILLGYWFWHLYRLPFVELEKEWQAIKAAGEPMRYEDLVPPIPPSLNAATVYQKAISALPTLSWTEEQMLDDLWNNRPVDKEKVRQILKRCQSALALVKRASRYPHSRWIKWQSDPYSIQLRHLAPLRLIARLLRTEALFHLQEGDVDKAFENCVVLLRMAHHLWEEPCD